MRVHVSRVEAAIVQFRLDLAPQPDFADAVFGRGLHIGALEDALIQINLRFLTVKLVGSLGQFLLQPLDLHFVAPVIKAGSDEILKHHRLLSDGLPVFACRGRMLNVVQHRDFHLCLGAENLPLLHGIAQFICDGGQKSKVVCFEDAGGFNNVEFGHFAYEKYCSVAPVAGLPPKANPAAFVPHPPKTLFTDDKEPVTVQEVPSYV